MSANIPIWLEEPGQRKKAEWLARNLLNRRLHPIAKAEIRNVTDLKQRLKEICEYTRDHLTPLTDELKATLLNKYPQVTIQSIKDTSEAINYIVSISDKIDTISINNSSVISRELKPGLTDKGYKIIDSYFSEFDINDRAIPDYWNLPHLLENNLTGGFEVTTRIAGLDDPLIATTEAKEYLAILGVNAISAEDGTIFFLQHFSNIYRDLSQAAKVILVISIDKIVRSREEAALVTESMGIFGMESWLLGIQSKTNEMPSITELPLLPNDKSRELHIIIVDNGRTDLLNTIFKDLLLCIGCRACNRHCPIHHVFRDIDFTWTPKNYLKDFLDNKVSSIDRCLHCEKCRLNCPLDIDLPDLMWKAKLDHIRQHGRSFYHYILGRPVTLAKVGTHLAPLANWMVNFKIVRLLMELTVGIDRKAHLPKFNRSTFRKWFTKR